MPSITAAEFAGTSSVACTFFWSNDANEALFVFRRRPSADDNAQGSGPSGCDRMLFGLVPKWEVNSTPCATGLVVKPPLPGHLLC